MRDYNSEIKRAYRSMDQRTHCEMAIKAANKLQYTGEIVEPPVHIHPARWRAMVNQIIKNGPPQ